MATQHTWLLATLALLAVVLGATEAGPYAANVEDSTCCKDYTRRPLPMVAVKDFYWTSLSCRRPGVVLVTVKNLEICADPSQAWVKRIIRKLAKGGRTPF
ncbi:C-C motif chemokine 22 [Sorex araneus]|uniref:C-C motif chemokine 22 n=1 Tax=Sorex araneus TaxID=42254 RepID=UPI00243376F0|nr:C-C motif chemokine 22 [Sorex araneus]